MLKLYIFIKKILKRGLFFELFLKYFKKNEKNIFIEIIDPQVFFGD